MAGRISTRISIKWGDEPAAEPTDTLVLSIGGYYVDLRIAKADESIDWALAGQRIVVSEQPHRVEFTHCLDSHECRTDDLQSKEATPSDVGQFTKLANGDDFETGEMPAPHLNGKITYYEETWRETQPKFVVSDPLCNSASAWILESKDEKAEDSLHGSNGGKGDKTFYARVGPCYLAVQRRKVTETDGAGESSTSFVYAAIRQYFDTTSKLWTTKYSVGDASGLWAISSGDPLVGRHSEDTGLLRVDDVLEFDAKYRSTGCRTFIVRAIGAQPTIDGARIE